MAGHDSHGGSTLDVPGTCFSSIIAIITAHRWCGDGPPCFHTAPCSNTTDPSGVSTRREQTPRVQGTELPRKTAPTSDACQSLQRSAALLTTWLQIRGFRNPLVRCSHPLWQLLELREAPSYILQLVIKGVMKDTEEQSVGQVRGARSGTVPSPGVSALAELGWATLLARGCVHHPRSFPSSVVQRPLWKLRHMGIIDISFISSRPFFPRGWKLGPKVPNF